MGVILAFVMSQRNRKLAKAIIFDFRVEGNI